MKPAASSAVVQIFFIAQFLLLAPPGAVFPEYNITIKPAQLNWDNA
jgi:hypothetical protein